MEGWSCQNTGDITKWKTGPARTQETSQNGRLVLTEHRRHHKIMPLHKD